MYGSWNPLDAAGCAFPDACSAGRPLAEAAADALHLTPDTDLALLLSSLLETGAFGNMSSADFQEIEEE
jgi:hypothetical protein